MDLQRKKNITFTIQLLTLNGLTTFQRIEKCGQHNIFFSEHTWELTPPFQHSQIVEKFPLMFSEHEWEQNHP